MIVHPPGPKQTAIVPTAFVAQLDEFFSYKRWALYRNRILPTGRKVPTELWELWMRGDRLERVASWETHQLPGCPSVGLSVHMLVEEKWRGKGLGKLLMNFKLGQARETGYKLLLCTCRIDNAREIRVLKAAGWIWLENFNGLGLWSARP